MSLSACYYDNAEELYPDACKKSNISYSEDIVPIMNMNCISCHASDNANMFGGEIDLESYSGIIETVTDSSLSGSINHTEGFSPMPFESMLPDCQRKQIEIWIEEGAKNN
ncbi:MAG: hypothetical protein C0594_08280 [Marinilabiliales bacterium]|nr:MAG: hypothetical protein C0594_08280 [Marinilabiliales bacterium]